MTTQIRMSRSPLPIMAIVGCCCIAMVATGCGNLEQPTAAKAYFVIEPGKPTDTANASNPAGRPTITIEPMHIAPPFDGVWFVYRIGPSQFDFDRQHVFAAPPASLLVGSLVTWLNQTGRFTAVSESSAMRSDLRLEGNITELYIDSTTPAARKAVIAGRFLLIQQRPGEFMLNCDIPFEQTVPVETESESGFAEAIGKAWRQALEQLTAKLTDAEPHG